MIFVERYVSEQDEPIDVLHEYIKNKYNIKLSKKTLFYICRNDMWFDTDYEPPEVGYKLNIGGSFINLSMAKELREFNIQNIEMSYSKISDWFYDKYNIRLDVSGICTIVSNKSYYDPDYVPPIKPNKPKINKRGNRVYKTPRIDDKRCKIDLEKANIIRQKYENGMTNICELTRWFNSEYDVSITRTTTTKIIKNKIWKT